MNKKQLTKALAGVVITSASVFFAYKLYITVKKVKAELAEEQALPEPVEASNIPSKEEYVEAIRKVRDVLEEALGDEIDPFADDEERYLRAEIDYIAGEPEHIPAFVSVVPEGDEVDDDEDLYVDEEKEMEDLRFPPNSQEALTQYKAMKMAEFDPNGEAAKILHRLYEVPFKPTNQSDNATWELLADEREQFFGPESIHNNKVTMADLVLYYAYYLDFDLDGGVANWTAQLLYNLDLSSGIGAVKLDTLTHDLVHHVFTNENGYGMFGLTDEEYQDMLYEVSNRATNHMTFMMQYNAYLKRQMESGGR